MGKIILLVVLILTSCINKQEVNETLKDLDAIQEDRRYFYVADINFLDECRLKCYDKKAYVVVDESFCAQLPNDLCDRSKVAISRSMFEFLEVQGKHLNELKAYWEDRLK